MAVTTIPTAVSWPGDLPEPQVLRQSVSKNPTVINSGNVPVFSALFNPLAPSHVTLVFFCTHNEMQDLFYFYNTTLFGGTKPFTIGLRVEDGYQTVTVRAEMPQVVEISEQSAEVTLAAEIQHRTFT